MMQAGRSSRFWVHAQPGQWGSKPAECSYPTPEASEPGPELLPEDVAHLVSACHQGHAERVPLYVGVWQ
jgi:hypothetical protein